MQYKSISAIGLMSGTSLDGLDIAYCQFEKNDGLWNWKLILAETVAYDNELLGKLQEASRLSGEALVLMDNYFGDWMGKVTKQFIDQHQLKPDLVASHGHTVFHQPEKGLSLQLGALNALHRQVEVPVVNNFRQLDILKGGQGAPLVPVGDELLFSEHQFCLNLGGIANISFRNNQGQRVAFDISVCNLGLNYLAQKEGKTYDRGGLMAQSGSVDQELFEQLNQIAYYQLREAKSLGLEDIEQEVFPLLEASTISNFDKMATLVAHISFQIAEVLNQFPEKAGTILVTGGGAFNQTLMDSISTFLNPSLKLAQVDNALIENKEAIIFAFLGVLRALDQVNIYASVTGAQSDSIAGDMIGKVCI